MLWAYLSFSQFLIIWSANLPEEIPHYLNRWDHGCQYLSFLVIIRHFILPYSLLLSRDLKRTSAKLRMIAIWIMVSGWSTTTGTSPRNSTTTAFTLSLLDVALPIALGGIFLSCLCRSLAAARCCR